MAATKKDQSAAGSGQPGEGGQPEAAELELARQLAERARAEGLQLTGPGGLLGRLTKVVLEGAWKASWTPISATRSTTRPAGTAGTPATGTGPRR